jgi:hypothetical protein
MRAPARQGGAAACIRHMVAPAQQKHTSKSIYTFKHSSSSAGHAPAVLLDGAPTTAHSLGARLRVLGNPLLKQVLRGRIFSLPRLILFTSCIAVPLHLHARRAHNHSAPSSHRRRSTHPALLAEAVIARFVRTHNHTRRGFMYHWRLACFLRAPDQVRILAQVILQHELLHPASTILISGTTGSKTTCA